MATLTVRNLPDEVHRSSKARAGQHGLNTEAELREIRGAAVQPEVVSLCDELAAFRQLLERVDLDIVRDPAPAEPALFE